MSIVDEVDLVLLLFFLCVFLCFLCVCFFFPEENIQNVTREQQSDL